MSELKAQIAETKAAIDKCEHDQKQFEAAAREKSQQREGLKRQLADLIKRERDERALAAQETAAKSAEQTALRVEELATKVESLLATAQAATDRVAAAEANVNAKAEEAAQAVFAQVKAAAEAANQEVKDEAGEAADAN